MRELLGQLPFEIAARLPIQLGRQSISSAMVAISELIKNSYDANSRNVRLNFIQGIDEIKSLLIVDDGHGMSYDEIKDNWLIIGTSHKTQQESSNNLSRVFTGAKGLGRLGADRLCKTLVLQTKRKEDDFVIELQIDWGAYENADKPLSQIKHKIFKVAAPINNPDDEYGSFPSGGKLHGTRIILRDLKEDWNLPLLVDLKKELSLLVSPFADIEDFSIAIDSGHLEVDGVITSVSAAEFARWVVDAEFKDGEVSASFKYGGAGGKEFTIDSVKWSDWIKDRHQMSASGPLQFKMYFVPWDAPELKSIDLSRRNWRDFMNANQGVRIYRDKFRVRPYGEPTGKGDWLDLGIRRAKSPGGVKQGGWKVGPHQIVGAVFIGRQTNPLLEDQTNREGIVESDAFSDMRAFCIKIIEKFESYAQKIAREEESGSVIEEKRALAKRAITETVWVVEDLKATIARAAVTEQTSSTPEDFLKKIANLESKLAETAARSAELEVHLEQKAEELESEKDTLANLASLGILTVCFGHEVKEFSNLSLVNARNLKDNFESGTFMLTHPYDLEFAECLKTIISSTGFVRNFASFALGNIRPDKRKRKSVDVGAVADGVFKALSASLDRQNIKFNVKCSAHRKVTAFEIDVESILVNFISNSIWALKKTPVGKRFISVDISESSEHVSINFADSGFGLEVGTEEQIFQPMYSTRLDRRGTVEGTGMGLAIVKSFVENHAGGTVTAIAKGRLGGAEFKLNIPLSN